MKKYIKNYVRDFEEYLEDESYSDGDIIVIAREYIKELQSKLTEAENKVPEATTDNIKVVIKDSDDCSEVTGILTLRNKAYYDLDKAFKEYRLVNEGRWTWENFVNYLRYSLKWDIDYERTNVRELAI